MKWTQVLPLLAVLTLLATGVESADRERVQAPPEEIPSYTIKRVNQGIEIDGVVDEVDWERTAPIYFIAPWSDPKKDGRQGTVARMLWDEENLYISYVCDDPYMDAEVTEPDGPVYEEDAVEAKNGPRIFSLPGRMRGCASKPPTTALSMITPMWIGAGAWRWPSPLKTSAG